MSKKILRRVVLGGVLFFLIVVGASVAFGKKPPWAGGPGGNPHDPPPVSAPEPTLLSLIGIGAAGVGIYHLIRKNRAKENRHGNPVG